MTMELLEERLPLSADMGLTLSAPPELDIPSICVSGDLEVQGPSTLSNFDFGPAFSADCNDPRKLTPDIPQLVLVSEPSLVVPEIAEAPEIPEVHLREEPQPEELRAEPDETIRDQIFSNYGVTPPRNRATESPSQDLLLNDAPVDEIFGDSDALDQCLLPELDTSFERGQKKERENTIDHNTPDRYTAPLNYHKSQTDQAPVPAPKVLAEALPEEFFSDGTIEAEEPFPSVEDFLPDKDEEALSPEPSEKPEPLQNSVGGIFPSLTAVGAAIGGLFSKLRRQLRA